MEGRKSVGLNRTTEDSYTYSFLVENFPARPERTPSLSRGKSKGSAARLSQASILRQAQDGFTLRAKFILSFVEGLRMSGVSRQSTNIA